MPDPTTQKYLKPKMIKVAGREKPELARLSFPGSNRELPEEGGWRPRFGREGSWWLRRVADGSAEVSEAPAQKPTPAPKPKVKKKET